LSPLLYCIFIDDLPSRIRQVADETDDAFLQHNTTLFADDIAAVASTREKLQRICDICDDHARVNHYRFAPLKCVILASTTEEPLVTLHNIPIPILSEFKFLGYWFKATGFNSATHVPKMMEAATTAANVLQGVGVNGRTYSANSIVKMYKTFVRPILEWGSNLHKHHSKIIQQLDRRQTFLLKKLLSVGIRTSTAAVLMLSGLEEMSLRTDYLRARTLYRFSTNPGTKLSKLAFEFAIQSGLNSVCTAHLARSPAWTLYQEDQDATHKQIKKKLLLSQMERLHLKDQLMCQLIRPVARMSNLFKARTSSMSMHISRRQKRLLILWKLGVLPLHPYKVCANCLDLHSEAPNISAASRDHISFCYGFDLKLPPIEHNISHHRASRLDILLEALPPLTKEPELATTLHWQYLAQFVEDMCNQVLTPDDYVQTMRDAGLPLPEELVASAFL
jgi:hypothetical protein